MTAKEFVNKYIGTAHDVDGVYGVQCVDLFKFLLKLIMVYLTIQLVMVGLVVYG